VYVGRYLKLIGDSEVGLGRSHVGVGYIYKSMPKECVKECVLERCRGHAKDLC
jgi:hypothetical protein